MLVLLVVILLAHLVSAQNLTTNLTTVEPTTMSSSAVATTHATLASAVRVPTTTVTPAPVIAGTGALLHEAALFAVGVYVALVLFV